MVVPVINAISFSPSTGITNKVSNSALSININKSSASQKTGFELQIGWEEPQDHARIFDMMRWSRRVSDFHGRDREMQVLKEWADSDKNISVKLITGEGGNGKTRLAAEFAEKMKNEGWDAGFINMYREREYHLKSDKGTILLIDYPEQYPDAVRNFFESLDAFQIAKKLRILFISRHSWEKWESLIDECSAGGKVSWEPLYVGKLDDESAHEAYTSAVEKISDELGIDDPNLTSLEAYKDWSSSSKENDKALFVLGLAVHDVIRNKDDKVKYSALEIVDALVNREINRLKKSAKSLDVKEDLFPVLLAMATIAGFAPLEVIRSWVINKNLNLGLKKDQDIEKILKDARLVKRDEFKIGEKVKRLNYIPALEPDIVASYFVRKVLEKDEAYAPERIWFALNDINMENAILRIERIDYDNRVLLEIVTTQIDDNVFSEWIIRSVTGDIGKCRRLEIYLSSSDIGECLLQTAIEVYEQLIDDSRDDLINKFVRMIILANHYSRIGSSKKALNLSETILEHFRGGYSYEKVEYISIIAITLNNISKDFQVTGDFSNALRASEKAVEMTRELFLESPEKWGNIHISSLNNYSNDLSNKRDHERALLICNEAVQKCRELLDKNRKIFEPLLGNNLINLSNRYFELEKLDKAFKYLKEAIGIFKRLSKQNPPRYNFDFAMCKSNLAVLYINTGKEKKAIIEVEEAIKINEIFVESYPLIYASEVAKNYGILGYLLARNNKPDQAKVKIEKGIKLISIMKANYPENNYERTEAMLKRNLAFINQSKNNS